MMITDSFSSSNFWEVTVKLVGAIFLSKNQLCGVVIFADVVDVKGWCGLSRAAVSSMTQRLATELPPKMWAVELDPGNITGALQ